MTTEREILKSLKNFRKIKPDKNWVFLTKEKILGSQRRIFPLFKPLELALFTILILVGLFKASEGALPGEPLYLIKRGKEEIQTIFVPEDEKPKIFLEITQKRAKELEKVANLNETKKLSSAIKEFKEGASKAARILVKSEKIDKEGMEKAFLTLQTVKKVEKNLETKVTPPQFEKAIEEKVKLIIKDLEVRSLTEKQKEILNSAKEDLENGQIERAFEKVMLILQNG